MSPVALTRMQRWRENGPQPPLTQCQRCDLGDSAWVGGEPPSSVFLNLRQIDPYLEIIYDRFTAKGDQPGHHLYYRQRTAGSPMGDTLVLQWSLQEDISVPWPQGKPRAPGAWVVDAVKKRHLKFQDGDEKHIAEHMIQKSIESADKKRDDADRAKAEADADVLKELAPYATRGRTLQPLPKGQRRRSTTAKGKKVISAPRRRAIRPYKAKVGA